MKQYLKSFFSFSIGTWLRAIIYFFSTPVITYLINPDEFGKSAMFATAQGIVNLVVFVGTDQAFVRFFYEYTQENRRKFFWSCLYPTLAMGALFTVIFVLFERPFTESLYGYWYPNVNLIFILSIHAFIFQRYNQLIIYMQKKGLVYSLIEVLNSLFSVAFVFIFVAFVGKTFYAIILANLAGQVLTIFFGLTYTKSFWKPSKVSLGEIQKSVLFGLPFLPTFLLHWVFTSIDRISLRQYSTFEQIGLYSAAFKVVSIMNIVQSGFSTFWVPTAYEKYRKSNGDPTFFVKANNFMSLIMFLLGFLILSSRDLIFMILQKEYLSAKYIFPFLMFSPIMYTLVITTIVWINFSNKTYWHIIVTLLAAVVNYIGNTMLVPILEARGAAISTGLSYAIYFYAGTIISERLAGVKYDLKRITLSTTLLCIVGVIQTFKVSLILATLSSILSIILVMIVYRKEFFALKREISMMDLRRFFRF